MCNITENFMEDQLYQIQLREEYEYKMWVKFIEEEEEKQKDYDIMAEMFFKDLEEYEKTLK